jgi:ABC-type transporter Mla subunit MlaD
MAPHDTNTPREAKRHAVPLIVMGVLLALALVGFLWWVANVFGGPDETEASPVEEQTTSQPAN